MLGTTVRLYRENWRRVVGAAFVVFGAIAILDTANDALADRLDDPVVALILLAASVLGVFGATFYSGLLDLLVGAAEYGGRRHSVGEVLRTLPYVRLMSAAALLLALTAIGTLLLIVPGLIVFTLFSLVGPLINIENLGVRRRVPPVGPSRVPALLAGAGARHAAGPHRGRSRIDRRSGNPRPTPAVGVPHDGHHRRGGRFGGGPHRGRARVPSSWPATVRQRASVTLATIRLVAWVHQE